MTESIIRIQLAEDHDVSALLILEEACFAIPWSEKSLRDFIADSSRSFCLVAREKNRVCGYVGMQYVLDEGDISNIAVLPDVRGRGIAKKLLETLFSVCEKRGIKTIHLEVRTGNAPAIALYEKMGFSLVGRRRAYYADTGEDALLYSREISEIDK